MVRWPRFGRDQAVSGVAVRRAAGRAARGSDRAAVRRHRSRGARALISAKSPHNVVHLTLPESDADAGRLFREWREQRSWSRTRPGSGRCPRTTSVPTGSREHGRAWSGRCRSSPTRRESCCRTSARTAGRRRGVSASCARSAPSSSRSSSSTKARGRSTSPSGRRTSRSRAPDSGGSARRLRSRRPSPIASY